MPIKPPKEMKALAKVLADRGFTLAIPFDDVRAPGYIGTYNQLGQEVLLSSTLTSFTKWRALFNVVSISLPNKPAEQAGKEGSGRPGGIRTPNPRIWSPVLYRSSYWPPLKANALRRCPPVACPAASLNLSVHDVLTTPPTIFLKLQTIRRAFFVLRR